MKKMQTVRLHLFRILFVAGGEKIDDYYRRKGKNNLKSLQVYICPLSINTTHLTMLEISKSTGRLSKERKIVEGLPNYVLESSRSSKRLKEVSKGFQTTR